MKKATSYTIGTKLWILTSFLLLSIAVVGGIAFWNSSQLIERLNDQVEIELPAVQNMTLVDMMHDGIRANVLNSIVASGSQDEKELKSVKEESEEFAKNINQYLLNVEKLPLDQELKAFILTAKPHLEEYTKSAHEIVEVALSGKVENALKLLPTFQEKFEGLEKELDKLGTKIRENAQTAGKSAHETANRAKQVSWMVTFLSLIAGSIMALFLIRNLRGSLNEIILSLTNESKEVAHTAVGLSQSSENLAESTGQQASALQETAASLDEITAMVRKTSENSVSLEKTAQKSHESASRGGETTSEMLEAIETIADSNSKIMTQVEEGNNRIAEIVKVISEIGNKTKVINDIVFQTKLLSFNASVEAARAGEHGKGFAVVAEEVGNLAQMSGNAAKEISEMLDSSIKTVDSIVSESKQKVETLIQDGRQKVDFGKEISKKCKDSLEEIVSQSDDVLRLISEISTAIREQNQGIDEISKALGQLNESANSNSLISKKTSESSADLLNQSNSLRNVMQILEAIAIGGKNESSTIQEHNNSNNHDTFSTNVISLQRKNQVVVNTKANKKLAIK